MNPLDERRGDDLERILSFPKFPVRLLGARLAVLPHPDKEKIGRSIIPPSTRKNATRPNAQIVSGLIVAMGPGMLMKNDRRWPMPGELGDRVLFDRYNATAFKHGDHEYLIVRDDAVIPAVLDGHREAFV